VLVSSPDSLIFAETWPEREAIGLEALIYAWLYMDVIKTPSRIATR